MSVLFLRRALLLLALAGRLAWPAAGSPADEEQLWRLLAGDGQVVLVRHAVTTPGVGDPPGMRLEDCPTQRNLSDESRDEARCLETARLAFGSPEVWTPLGNLFGRPENRQEQVRRMRELVGERVAGGNLVLVSHGSTISALTGVSPGTAEMVILTPRGAGSFTVVGTLTAP